VEDFFQHAATSRTSGTYSSTSRLFGWLGFWVMLLGNAMAAVMILLNEATVLYTFYAPLKAHWIFYLGLTFVVVGSWLGGAGMIMNPVCS
jgi:cytochrome c oxidase subunit I